MNQSVLVTAGASGIGREIARAFAVQGAKVVVCDIDSKALETLAQEIPAITTVVCDVSKRHDIREFGIRANAILPGAVEGPRIQRVLEDRAKLSGKSVEEEKKSAMSVQSLQRFVDRAILRH
jgi:NAD(P)-dependent dehydrogenase (short-subunit alcohol dehydrogenase family)